MLDYYKIAKEASLKIAGHPGLEQLKSLCADSNKVLDVGCGEGTRLHTLLPKNKSGTGIDISVQAINLAKKSYPRLRFFSAAGESMPFPDSTFDLVYSAFALEHCANPENFISEMFRVCKTAGTVVILCPNFGAPNRRSPVSTQNPLQKLFFGFVSDFLPNRNLNWTRVTPKKTYNQIDDDTTLEPYLLTLISYILGHRSYIQTSSSLWELESPTKNPRKLLFKALGQMGVYPFKYWGPQIFLVAIK